MADEKFAELSGNLTHVECAFQLRCHVLAAKLINSGSSRQTDYLPQFLEESRFSCALLHEPQTISIASP